MAGFIPLPKTFASKNYWAGADENWGTKESQSETTKVDFAHQVAHAPTDTSDHAIYERAKANAIIATSRDWEPVAKAERIPYQVYSACDDERVAALLDAHDRGEHTQLAPPHRVPEGLLDFYLESENVLGYFTLLLAANNPASHGRDKDALNTHTQKLADSDEELSEKQQQMVSLCQRAADDALNSTRREGLGYRARESLKDASKTDEMAKAAWPHLARILDPGNYSNESSDSRPEDEEFVELADCNLPEEAEGNQWCDVQIVLPDLTLKQKPGLRAPAYKQTDAGAYIRRPERHCTDGLVFGNRRRQPKSGSVLIDISGSMSLTLDEIEEMMTLAPGVNIATYCSGGYTGFLTIVARGNKRCSTEDLRARGGGNGIDGPALRWLAAQPGPRYHISDGLATGRGEAHNGGLMMECEAIRRAHRITRLESLEELIQARKNGEL